jgi:hypothetical protein
MHGTFFQNPSSEVLDICIFLIAFGKVLQLHVAKLPINAGFGSLHGALIKTKKPIFMQDWFFLKCPYEKSIVIS